MLAEQAMLCLRWLGEAILARTRNLSGCTVSRCMRFLAMCASRCRVVSIEATFSRGLWVECELQPADSFPPSLFGDAGSLSTLHNVWFCGRCRSRRVAVCRWR